MISRDAKRRTWEKVRWRDTLTHKETFSVLSAASCRILPLIWVACPFWNLHLTIRDDMITWYQWYDVWWCITLYYYVYPNSLRPQWSHPKSSSANLWSSPPIPRALKELEDRMQIATEHLRATNCPGPSDSKNLQDTTNRYCHIIL